MSSARAPSASGASKNPASRDASTFSTSWKVVGGVDLRKLDLGLADDRQLVANLTNERVDPSGVEQRILASARSGLRVTVRAELPDGTARQVSAVPGRRAALVATAEDSDLGRQMLVIAGVVVGILVAIIPVPGFGSITEFVVKLLAERAPAGKLVTLGPGEGFFTFLEVAMIIGISLSMPVIVRNASAFCASVSSSDERDRSSSSSRARVSVSSCSAVLTTVASAAR